MPWADLVHEDVHIVTHLLEAGSIEPGGGLFKRSAGVGEQESDSLKQGTHLLSGQGVWGNAKIPLQRLLCKPSSRVRALRFDVPVEEVRGSASQE